MNRDGGRAAQAETQYGRGSPSMRSVTAVLERAASRWPTRQAIVTDSVSLTYRQLQEQVDRLAAGLVSAGVGPGDRLAACLPNDAPLVVAFYAAAHIGAIWVGINRSLAPAEKARLLADTTPKLLLSTAETIRCLAPQLQALDVEGVEVDDDGRWSELSSGTPTTHPHIDPLAPAAIAFTSGTSGAPKGVVHSQHGLVLLGEVLAATRGYDETLRRGDYLPLTILNLITLSTLTAAQVGGASLLHDGADAASLAAWIRRHEVNAFSGVPTTFHDLIRTESIRRDDLASLRDVWSGGAACADHLRDHFLDRFGHVLHMTYGLTEAPAVVAIDPPGDPSPSGKSGRPLPHLDMEFESQGAETDGGEIVLSAAACGRWAGAWRPFLGYWNQPEAATPVLEGRLHTGDIGRIEDGRLVVVDRLGSVIIRGGANVYPAEVERVLRDLPAVADAVVVGMPDSRLGETVHALVELDRGQAATEEELLDACRGQLSKYKVPVRLVIVDALVRNALGKPDQGAARARLKSEDS